MGPLRGPLRAWLRGVLPVSLRGLPPVLLVGLLAAGCDPDGAAGDPPAGVPAGAQPLVVEQHVDGDTVRVRFVVDGPAGEQGEEVAVRLLEVDTPEVDHDGGSDECFAQEASRRLARLLPVGSTAYGVPDRELLDPYGRTLLYLWTGDDAEPVFVNETLVVEGYARAVMYPPNDRYEDRMRAGEARARSAGRGLWGECPFFGAPG